MSLENVIAEADTATGAQPQTPQTPEPTQQPELVDPDDIELQDALKAVEAEGAAGKTPPDGEAATATASTPADQGKPADAQPAAAIKPADKDAPADGPMIPKARFDEAVSKEREANAKLLGENEALKLMLNKGDKPASAQQQPQAQTPSAADRLKTIRDERLALAKKFDDGEISQSELTAKQIELEDQAQAIREEQLASRFKPAAAASAVSDSLSLEKLTEQLELDHPYVKEGVLSEADFAFLHRKAIDELRTEGVNLPAGVTLPERERFLIRERIAVLSDRFGPVLTGKTIEKPSASSGTQPAKPGLSPQAQARQAKLETAANAPPDISRTGSAGASGTGEYTEAQIAQMSDDEIAALPRSVKDRFLQSTA